MRDERLLTGGHLIPLSDRVWPRELPDDGMPLFDPDRRDINERR